MSGARTATVGLFLAGVGLVLTLFGWQTVTLTGSGLAVPVGFAAAAVTALAFSANRHGRLDPSSTGMVAGGGGIVLVICGVWLLVAPPGTGIAPWLASLLVLVGVGCVAIGGVNAGLSPNEGLVRSGEAALIGMALGFAGLFLAGSFAGVPELIATGLGVEFAVTTGFALEQIGIGIGYLVATIGFLVGSGRGLGYLDIDRFDRQDITYVVGGTALIVTVAILIGFAFAILGIELGEHALARRAREEGAAILLVAIPLALVATALGEELLFRNGVQKYLTERFTPTGAILLSCLIFTAAHVPAFLSATAVAFVAPLVVVFTLSLILAVIYERTRNVLVTVVIHGSYNALVFLTIYWQLTG